jgi:hypothetical protein
MALTEDNAHEALEGKSDTKGNASEDKKQPIMTKQELTET